MMLVIAFDGILFDSMGARAMILSDALAAEGFIVADDVLRETLAGRTFSEAVRYLASTADAGVRANTNGTLDATSQDIATLRAGQAYATLASRGFSFNVRARDLLVKAAAVTRVVLRADSRRRETELLLAFAGLDNGVSMLRCSDDPSPRTSASTVQTSGPTVQQHNAFDSTIRRSYQAILERMTSNNGLLGEKGSPGVSLEVGALPQQVAAGVGFEIATSLSTLNYPAR